jgi:hypothetical protein
MTSGPAASALGRVAILSRPRLPPRSFLPQGPSQRTAPLSFIDNTAPFLDKLI